MDYIIYNKAGKIFRLVECPPAMSKIQAKKGKFIMEGTANDATQKVEFDGFDVNGQPINPRIVDKTPEEIEAEKPKPPPKILFEKRAAAITNKQWQDVLDRLEKLETEA